MDDQIPVIRAVQEHFDLQFHEIRAGQEATREQINATNSRIVAMSDRVTDILAETRKTNGRVTMLEQWRSFRDGVEAGNGQSWRVLVAGSAIVGSIVGVVISIITFALGT